MALAEGRPPRRRSTHLLAMALAGAMVAVFLPMLGHEWLNYDDDIYITDNAELLRGLSLENLSWAFTTLYGANWFPLTWLSWMLDLELWGLKASGFLATNLLLHVATAVLLLHALARMTGSLWRSAFVAAVFALHPLHVESVAWAAARKDTLSGLFFALVLLLYASSGPLPASRRRRAAVFACLAAGLMAKPVLVTIPFLLLLLDFWPLGRLSGSGAPGGLDPARVRAAVIEKLPLLALVLASCAMTLLAQGRGGTVAPLEWLPLGIRLENSVISYAAYLGSALWPTDLAIFYPHPGVHRPLWEVLAAAGLLASVTGLSLLWIRRRPYLAVGWLWYLLMLLPMIGLVQVGSQARADRYTYLPLIGLSIAITWGVCEAIGRSRAPRAASVALAIAALTALGVQTSTQLCAWRDSEALFRHALGATGENPVAHAHLGLALAKRGDARGAIEQYQEALRLRRDYARVANNLAWLLAACDDQELRNPERAMRLAERATRLSEKRDPTILDTLALAYAVTGRTDSARRVSQRAIQLAREQGDLELVASVRKRLALYERGEVYRERCTPEHRDAAPPE